MLGEDGETIIGDLNHTQFPLGSQGWNTGGAVSRDGQFHAIWFDVGPLFAREFWTPGAEYEPVLDPAKVPERLVGISPGGTILPGNTAGGWWAGFGGPDGSVCYYVTADGCYVSTDFDTDRTFSATDLIDVTVNPNAQRTMRSWKGKGATDPYRRAVCFIHMGSNGFYRTTNLGVDFPELTWCPRPTAMNSGDVEHQWGITTVDELGPTAGSGPAKYCTRGAVCPDGQGIYQWTDGGDSGTKITNDLGDGPGGFESVSCMKYLSGGRLLACVVDTQTQTYDAAISTATGGGGVANDNIRLYDPSAIGDEWSIVDHGAATNSWFQELELDPRYSGEGYFAQCESNEFMHTADGETFVYTGMGNGYQENGVYLTPFVRMLPTNRPAMAARFRYAFVGFANSGLCVVPDYSGGDPHPVTGVTGPQIVAHTGLGPVMTPLNDWPTESSDYGTAPLHPTKQALWHEICAKAEAKVGQMPLFLGDTLWNGAQDISVSEGEDGSRGHLAAVYTYPPTGGLSDAIDMARGPIKNFGVVYRQRSGQAAVQGVSFTTDNKEWHLAPHQSVAGLSAYEPGTIACGKDYSAVILPGWSHNSDVGHVPVVWSDIRSAMPVEITFKKENGDVVPMVFDQGGGDPTFNGFQAAYFSTPSKKVAIDPDNPSRYYFWNIGGSADVHGDPNGDYGWPFDPDDYGGIYMMDLDDPSYDPESPIATRVYSAKVETGYGSPNRMGNFGTFDTAFLIANGHIVLMSNYLWGGPDGEIGNRLVVLRISDWTRRVLTTGPGNNLAACLGDPLYGDVPCLWAVGYWSGEYCAAVSHDWYASSTPSWQGPFDVTMPTGGMIGHMDAHLAVEDEVKRFSKLAFSLRTRGIVFSQLQLS